MLLTNRVKPAPATTSQPSIQAPIRHINCVTHEGKVVLLGTDADGKLWYNVKQDGFEESYLQKTEAERTGWEDWQLLSLPNETDDESVIEKEKAELTKQDGTYLLQSRYKTHDQSAVAPVQLVSALGYIYVFRESKSNTLLVDRFVLDGLTNTLNRKLDVRFKRSRQKHKPIQSQRKSGRGLLNIDALDFMDIQGNPFYEPTTELSLVDNLQDGWFSVVLLPTEEQDKYRWHIFAYNSNTKTIEITTLRASEEGLFDVKDYTILEPEPRKMPGIIKRTLNLGSSVTVANGITATRYDIQRERETEAKDEKGKVVRQLLRESVRVMLVVGTNRGSAIALSFAVAADGTLSKIAPQPETRQIFRSVTRQILMPPNMLNGINAINVGLQPEKQRGIVLDGVADHITLPVMNHDFSKGLTVEAWMYFDQLKANASIIDFGNGAKADNIILQISDVATSGKAGLRLAISRDYDLKLIATGGISALPATGNRLIAIARDDENQLSLKIFNAQGTVAFPQSGETLTSAALEKMDALKSLLKLYWNNSVAKIPPEDQKRIIEAVRGVLLTQRSAIATQDEHSIRISDVLETQRWIHLAATIDATGQATLYKDGDPIKTGFLGLPPSLQRSQNYLGKRNINPALFWPGKLSQVRLWNRVCSASEVKNGMMLPARDQAPGLVGDWRLDAIAEGTQRTVVDCSINGNDGIVMGQNAYINHSVVLQRHLAGTETVAERYENEDLFAVSEGATYLEEFEFRPQRVAADGKVSAVAVSGLTFIYKGKKNHSAQDWLPISANPSSLIPPTAESNWYKASCQFTVPDGISLMRSFGIGNIVGSNAPDQQWTQIEIRRHKITLVADSITAETYKDTPTLQIPTAATPNQSDPWQRLTALEQAEGVLLLRRQALERAKNSPIPTGNPQQQIQQQRERVRDLEEQYKAAQENPFYHWCYIIAKHSNRCIQAFDNEHHNGSRIKQGVSVSDSNRGSWTLQWKFEPVGDGYYKISSKYTSLCLHISGRKKSENFTQIDQHSWADVDWLKWKVEKLDDGSYKILSKHSLDKGLDVSGISMDDGAKIQLLNWDRQPSRQWQIQPGEALPIRDAEIAAKKRELDAARDNLQELQNNLQLLEDKQDNQTKLDAVVSQLERVQREIEVLQLDTPSPLEVRSVATDDRQLTTQGAVLDFVRPASRLSSIETCEGNVQLSYFDQQGRIRLINFDAAADSNNTTFEEWLPDIQQSCLNFNTSSSAVTLTTPISLDQEWTIEAWFFYPFPANVWTVLVDGNSERQPIVVRDGKHLGTRIGDRFYHSGYTLDNLAVGWHHLGTVTKGSDSDTTTVFYIDGQEVGKIISTAALVLDGKDDYLDCGDKIDLTSKSFTIEFWAKRASVTTSGHQLILSQGPPEANKGLHIGFRSSNHFTFAFHNGFELDLNTDPYTDTNWHHWACVYNAGTRTRQIYCDGEKVAEKSATPDYIGTGNFFVGKAWEHPKFNGQINELRIWNKPLTRYEIQAVRDKSLTSADQDLLGWWQFSVDRSGRKVVIDRSPKQATATLQGDPTVERFPSVIDIKTIGNAKSENQQAGSQQAGKLAEIRVWKVALSSTEIAVNSKTLLSGNEPGLVAYYPLNEDTGTVVRNQASDSNNGSGVGTSWQVCALPIGSLRAPTIQFSDRLFVQIDDPIMQFDGVNDYIELPLTGSALQSDFTVEAWIKPSELVNNNLSILGTDSIENNQGLHLLIRNKKAYFGFFSNDTAGTKELTANTWYHVSFSYERATRRQSIFINGELDKSEGNRNQFQGTGALKIGSSLGGNYFKGCIAELRIWNKALTAAQIQAYRYQRLTGKEPNLIAYYPLNSMTLEGSTSTVTELVSSKHGTVQGATLTNEIANAVISCEYSTVSQDKSAMMRRFLAAPSPQGVHVLPDKRIEQLEMQWIGNGQFAPTLLGYIEGSPPIPSENLTLEDNYNGATSVELALSEDVEFKWTRSEESTQGASVEAFYGVDTEESVGVGFYEKIMKFRLGVKSNLESNWQFNNESSIASSSSLSMTDKLQLSGTQEREAYFPHLGKRFIPKNVGYALVISSLADVFVSRLKRTGRMVGYQVLPVDGIPPDVNTITFLINPAYTMSGSLDGMTGSSATSQRFFKHVPEMRSRFGSLYPASYYRLKEAYDLKQQIEQQDKDREAYFVQFDSKIFGKYRKSVDDENTFNKQIDSGNAPKDISPTRLEDKPYDDLTPQQQADQAAQQSKQAENIQKAQAQQSGIVKQKQDEIQQRIKDPNMQANASASLARWQRRMEDIQIRCGKRNIVNTYVWDADGGLRAEAQSFANTAEHSIGGSFSLSGATGFDTKFTFGFGVELTAQATFSLTQTMSKTETRSKGIQLNVDLSGVESRSVTNYDDLPLLPGEKVNRYRFMSFYLEGSTNHFQDFFSYVVDPEWLAGNSEEARALRQARGKANKTWRVLHRVTYVERPTLAGFSRDARQLPPAISEEEQQIALLKGQVATLENKLDQILQLLNPNNSES